MKITSEGFRLINKPLSFTTALLVLACLLFPYHYGILYHSLTYSIVESLVLSVIMGCILWICIRLDLAKVTVCFLALPYLFFIPGWLNTPAALVLLCIVLYCLKTTLTEVTAVRQPQITVRDLLAFIMIAIIVNLSGAGGYGYQWNDWNMHNARLKDLVEYTWPVRYGDNQNFVYYFGYFLPSAALGKLTSVETGLRSLYPWTLLGMTLAMRWLALLGRARFGLVLALLFIAFGPLDIINVLIVGLYQDYAISDTLFRLSNDPHGVDFTLSRVMPFFLGNYLSNTFSLYWSPQQVIASWLCISLLTHLYWQQQGRQQLFIYALLCLWGPLVMIALLPFVLLASAQQLARQARNLFTVENILGAGSLVTVFVLFYLGGSAARNPSFWIFNYFNHWSHWLVLGLLYLNAWGIYALATSGYLLREHSAARYWFVCLVLTLMALPLYTFGEWSDLFCRGSSPLMFLLLIFILRAMHHYREQQAPWKAILLLCLLIPGALSAFITNRFYAIPYYGQTQPVASVISYDNAYPNLGPDNTLFNRFLRRQPPSP